MHGRDDDIAYYSRESTRLVYGQETNACSPEKGLIRWNGRRQSGIWVNGIRVEGVGGSFRL